MALPACAPRASSSIGSKVPALHRLTTPALGPALLFWDATVRSRYRPVNQIETMIPAKLAGSDAFGVLPGRGRVQVNGWGTIGAGARRICPGVGRGAPCRHGRRHRGPGRRLRLHHPARHGAADVAGVHRPHPRGFSRDREGSRAPGHPVRAQERRRHRDGAARSVDPGAHEARRRRPAQGRRHRIRDLRQVRHPRGDLLRPEHQSLARARGGARAHHQGDRPGAGGARAPGAAGTPAVLARQDRALRLDRAARARRARGTAGAGDPPPGRLGGERAEAAARFGGGRGRPAARRRRGERRDRRASGARPRTARPATNGG